MRIGIFFHHVPQFFDFTRSPEKVALKFRFAPEMKRGPLAVI